MLMLNWNLMGDTKVEEVATDVLVSLILEILFLELISQIEKKKRGRTAEFSTTIEESMSPCDPIFIY